MLIQYSQGDTDVSKVEAATMESINSRATAIFSTYIHSI